MKKLTAMLLSITMVFSIVANAFPVAYAAGESVSTPVEQSGTVENGGIAPAAVGNTNFEDSSVTNRPSLYVDFLGDNRNYDPAAVNGTGSSSIIGGTALNGLATPADKDQSGKTNSDLASNTKAWQGYKQYETDSSSVSIYDQNTIFWVGVGIDRMHLLELLKDGDGIYGLELGFYYDNRYLEPYTGTTANDDAGYKTMLEAANINNPAFQNQWSGDYTILEAHTDMKPQTDPVTQEVIKKADMDTILSDSNWRMTYVSLEYQTTNVAAERFTGENGKSNDETQYLIMIPFRLKAYDTNYDPHDPQVYLRLARSAGLFSISGGKGDSPYAAWERVTTRNPHHELKLMTNFTGDLDIFGGGKYLEPDYKANLEIINAGGNGNTAKLSIKDDPSTNPVYVDRTGTFISGLRGGIGMQLEVHVDTGYKVKVTVYYTDSDGNTVYLSYTTKEIDSNNYYYTFIMPEHDVNVKVEFLIDDAKEFWLFLKEQETDRDGNTATSGNLGNYTEVTASYNQTVSGVTTSVTTLLDKDSALHSHSRYGDLPAEKVPYASSITANVSVHGDYEAVVWFERESTMASVAVTGLPADAVLAGTDPYIYILPTGGSVTLSGGMPKSDVVVHVTYRPAVKYKATLEVVHEDVTTIPTTNVAQLTTTVYDSQNEAQKAYSGVVFEDDTDSVTSNRYRHTETDFRVLDRVDASSATGSGSIGGDGRTPMAWSASADSLTALLVTATSTADLSGIAPLDLRWNGAGQPNGKQPAEGLRKNAEGEFYTDSDISDFYNRLMELKTLIDTAITAEASGGATSPVQKVTATATDGTSYTYYDLTVEQVQMYLLDYEAYQTYLTEKAQYDIDKAQYDADLVKYNQYLADKATAESAGLTYEGAAVREPKLPTAPLTVTAPALRTQADAQTAVAAHNWYTPSTTATPPTATTDCYLEVRGGRQMAVVLEAGTDYQVKTIELIDPTGTNSTITLDDASGKLTRNPDYQNEYLFTMPEYECIVRVTYTARSNQNVKLEIVGDYRTVPTATADAEAVADNYAELTGYSPNPLVGSTVAVPFGPLKEHNDNAQALVGSTVSLRVYKSADYNVSVEVLRNNGTTDVPVATTGTTTNVSDGGLVTFTMPADATRVIVTYTKNANPLNAHLIFDHIGTQGSSNGGYWDSNHMTDRTAYEGDALDGTITVQAGYYIYAAEAYTEDGSYPFTLSGNGWNNGAGGTVTLDTTMPDKEYWVKIVFKKGPPDPEPAQILRLTVNDPENTGADDNWAKIVATRVTTNVATLTAGKGATGGGVTSVSTYAQAGDDGVLTFGTASGYYVTAIAIMPDGTSASLTRVSATEATFVVPATSINVVVTFSKTPNEDKLYLTLAKTENNAQVTENWKTGATVASTEIRNSLLTVNSPSISAIGGLSGGLTVPESGATNGVNVLPATLPSGVSGTTTTIAQAGETVTVKFIVSSGWYVDSLSVSGDDGRLGYTLTKNDGSAYDKRTDYKTDGTDIELTATFVMPASDVYVSVNYRSFTDKPYIDEGEHQLELVVQDPDNTATPYANNTASATVSGVGATVRTIPAAGALGKATANGLRGITSAWAGEEVVIDYSADTGYTMELILVTPAGLHVPVTYFVDTDGKVKARFTMPDSDCTAIVRFKEGAPKEYTANLVLHFPSGTPMSKYDSIGEGSFHIGTYGLDSGNKLYSMNATAGQVLDLDLLAHDGYYISKVTAEAAALGVTVNYTGAFGRQTGDVVMPADDLQINVYFAKGWPDEAEYNVTLKVFDSTGLSNNANFVSVNNLTTLTDGTPVDTSAVYHGGSVTVTPVMDEDLVRVAINPVAGCYAKTITVRDSRGYSVPWQYVTGGIAFSMTPANVTVTVRFAKIEGVEKTPTVTLHTNADSMLGSATVTHPDGSTTITTNGGSFGIDVPAYGQTVTVTASPNSPACITSAYAVTASGAILPLVWTADGTIHTDMPQVTAGGTVTFAMPAENVDVYVNFNAVSPSAGDQIGMLTVVGESGSGSGVMYATANTGITTGTVTASGANSLFAPHGTDLTVDLTVNSGYSIKTVRVTDGNGDPVSYVWTSGSQFTLTMQPTGGVRVYVELEKNDPAKNLTAQIVVNNDGEADNKATLRLDSGVTGSYHSPVHVGDNIHIDVEIKSGYQVEYIKIVPAKFGLSATMTSNPAVTGTSVIGQTGSFVMPNEDVVVYVKFTKDTRTRHKVILTATGTADSNGGNNAYMTNGYTLDTSVLVYPSGYSYTPNTDTIQAAPATATTSAEWVTVDYAWVSGSCVKSVTVKDASGNAVPFTQLLNDTTNRRGQITFPMVASDPVNVVVEWADEKDLPKYDAILHVIDLDHPAASNDSWGKLTWNGSTPPTTTGEFKSWTPSTTGLGLGEEKIQVPAGETVTVDVFAQEQGAANQTYIKAAYVLCRKDGQMIKLNLTPDDPTNPNSSFTGSKTADFVMHPGQNDVYVYFTKDPQKLTDYAAVLMLDSPASDTNSTATISRPTRTGESGTAISDTVRANVDNHGYITATNGETITISVKPATGYVLDSVLMTPLGIEASDGGTVRLIGATLEADGTYTYTFTMPAENVAVRVKLKEGTVPKKYKAYLNYGLVTFNGDGTTTTTDITDLTADWAKGSFTDGTSTVEWNTNHTYREVPDGTSVTVGAQVIPSHYILAAYVLTDEGVLVPLVDAMEGKVDVYPTDNTKIDHDGAFTMPAEDVHIYVWFSNDKPLTAWHTAVLTAVDKDDSGVYSKNSGKNSASIESDKNNVTPVEVWSYGEPAHKFIWVEQGETVSVKTVTIDSAYQYVVTSLTANSSPAPTLTAVTTEPNNKRIYTVPNENTAAVVHFETSTMKESRLNVVLIDPDNPGEVGVRQVKNIADVTVNDSTTAALRVESVTSAGARQVIQKVRSGKTVTFVVTPASGYSAIALWKDSKGDVQGTWALNELRGSFTMPNEEATLEIYYFKSHTVTLDVTDTRGSSAPTSTAQMTENRLGLTAETADNTTPKQGVYNLPTGTTVTAEMTAYGANTKLLSVLVTNEYGTFPQTLQASPYAQYPYTISNDTNICFVLGDSTKTNEYVASVSAVNRPIGTDLPTIAATPVNPAHGDQWTAADSGNTITVTVKVPAGYEASLTATGGASLSTTLVTNTGTSESTETITFTMPANNVHVTVTYKKVRFTATIRTAGTGSGSADLDASTGGSATAVGTITGLKGSEIMTYAATPDSGSSVSHILLQTAGGSSSLLTAPNGSFTMPEDDVTVTVVFDTDSDKHHIAYVTTVDTDGMPNNVAKNIENTDDATLDTSYGTLYTYADKDHNIFVSFTTEAGYTALVTAHIAGTTTVVPVTQLGTSGNCTATLVMPDADVEVVITYYTVDSVKPNQNVTLRLVGHEQDSDNSATLTYQTASGTGSLSLTASGAGSNDPYYSTKAVAVVGGTLDLDAWRDNDFIFERMTVANWNGDKTNPILYTEVDLTWNEYLTNGISLFTMPNAETLVTVYYGHPYHATLFVIDKDDNDYNGGTAADGSLNPADTDVTPHDRVPTVKMESTVGTTTPTNNPTTKTHDPIDNLDGRETITTTVNGDNSPMPADSEIASVIASTKSGTKHLPANAGGTSESGVYDYKMSDLPTRKADNVDIIVVLRDKNNPNKLHTATVYKVNHDDKANNSASITNDTNGSLPKGDIWTAGYKDDDLTVRVTTETGYYALVTAVDSLGNTVPVIQWAVTGTSSDPIVVDFVMPDADLDITVTYYKGDPPKDTLKLTIKDHGDKTENVGRVYGSLTSAVTTSSTKLLEATGAEAYADGITAGGTAGTNPFSKEKNDVTVGTYLLADTATHSEYYVKSVTMRVGSTTYDLLDTTLMATFQPRLPVGGAEIIVEFAQGKVTGRPYDPEHSETYNSSTVHATGDYQQGVNTGDSPDLSKAPLRGTAESEGWILAESVDVDAFTFVVTVPTLFDKNEKDTTTGDLKLSDALKDAGIDPASAVTTTNAPPTYKFYWWDTANSKYVEFTTELTITAQTSLSYTDNPKGDFPKGTTDQHYGYKLTLRAIIPATGTLTDAEQILKDCFENGGAIYVTATNQTDLYIDGTKAPWIESEKTQVVVQPDNVLKPYDPDTTGNPNYEDHWIRAENRGDYLIVTVPMLNNKAGDSATSVDDSTHRLRLYLQDDAAGDRKAIITDVTDLLNIVNIRGYENKWNENLDYDGTWTAGSDLFEPYYENDVYYTDTSGTTPVAYNGAKFAVTILTDAEIDASSAIAAADKATAKANAAILRQIFDNEGTMGTNKYRMYITSDAVTTLADPLPTFRIEDYADFEVPRYYSLNGVLQSWSPTHLAELTLYRYDGTAGAYEKDPAYKILSGLLSKYADTAYEDENHTAKYDPAVYNDRWSIDFAFKSSELANDTYKLVVKKTSHITYTHTDIDLTVPATTTANYDATELKFSFSSPISLICGDIAPVFPRPDQRVDGEDRTLLSRYLYGNLRGTWSEDGYGDADWATSIFNPESSAYAADLDGDGFITANDWNILMVHNWKKATADYGTPSGLTFAAITTLSLTDEERVVDTSDSTYQVTEDTDTVYKVTEDTKPIDNVYRVTEDANLIYGISADTDLRTGTRFRATAPAAGKREIFALPVGEDEDAPPTEESDTPSQ